MNNQRKIIEALDNDRMATPLRQSSPKNKVDMIQSIPDYNIGILLFNDKYHTCEVALTDKTTGEEFCRHVFEDITTLNAFISEAFYIKGELNEAENRKNKSVKVIEHRMMQTH